MVLIDIDINKRSMGIDQTLRSLNLRMFVSPAASSYIVVFVGMHYLPPASQAKRRKRRSQSAVGRGFCGSHPTTTFFLSIQIDFVKTDGWFRKFISLTAMVIDFTARVGTLTKTSLSIWIHGARWQPLFVSTEMNQDQTVQEAYFIPNDYTHTIHTI